MVAPLAMMGLNLAAGAVGRVTAAVGASAKSDPRDKLKKQSDDFETVFLEQTLDRLTENGGKDGPLGEGGTGGDVYRSMLAKEYAGSIVKSGGVGISGQVYRQLLQLQEGAGHAAAG